MIFQFLALQLLSATVEPSSVSPMHCKLQSSNFEKQVDVSVDKNGIGYLNELHENLNFQAIIANNKINKIQISDTISDSEVTKDMLSADSAAVNYKDIKNKTLASLDCSANSFAKK